MPVPVIVIVKPRAAFFEEMWQTGPWLLEQVKEHEPYISAYRYYKSEGLDGPEIIIYFETDKEESLKDRHKLAFHQEVKRQIEEKDSLREPYTYHILREEMGWKR